MLTGAAGLPRAAIEPATDAPAYRIAEDRPQIVPTVELFIASLEPWLA